MSDTSADMHKASSRRATHASESRPHRGSKAYRTGSAAEQIAERAYEARGAKLLETRWRGAGGEIDLIVEEHGVIVFVEVKAARDFPTAAERIRPAQIARILASAEDYAGRLPKGLLSDMRFDVALVNGYGDCQLVENALSG